MRTLPLRYALFASALALAAVPRAARAQAPALPTPAAQDAAPPAAQDSAAPAAPGADAGQEITVGGVTITGENFEQDPATGQYIVTGGNPRAARGDQEVRATRLIYNPDTNQATGEGNVVIRRGNDELFAQRATYNFETRKGQADNARTHYGAYYIIADQMFIQPGTAGTPVYQVIRGRLTTCDFMPPHYDLYGRTIDIIPDDQLVVHHMGIDFLGHRLITIPRYERSLKKDEEENSLYPTFGYDRRDGPYIEKDFTLKHEGPLWLDANLRINTFHEPSGGILAATPGRRQLVAALYYRDQAENQRIRHLEVSRLPEVGMVWGNGQTPRPGRFLAHQVSGVRRPDDLNISTDWRLQAQISAGYFHQNRGDRLEGPDSETKDGGRFTAQIQGILPEVRLFGPLKLNDFRLMARQHLYDTGDAFTVLGAGIGKEVNVTKHWTVRADYFRHTSIGSTPFLFDDIELRQEVRPRLEYHSKLLNFSYIARLRGDNFDLYDQEFAVSRLFHCLEPRLSYRVRTGTFLVELRIPGFSGGARAKAGEARTTDSPTGRRPQSPLPPPAYREGAPQGPQPANPGTPGTAPAAPDGTQP